MKLVCGKCACEMTDEKIRELAREYIDSCTKRAGFVILTENIKNDFIDLFIAGYMKCLELNASKPKWYKLDWKQDYPKLDRLVRVRTQNGEEYICETYAYRPTEDEIGYGTILTQFEQLNGDWVDDNEIEYWCYIEPFKE